MNWPLFQKFLVQNKIPVTILVVATALLLWFVGNFVTNFIYFNDPKHQDESLKGWMTPRYVMMSYDLPRKIIIETLQIPENGSGSKRLDRIAQEQGLSLKDLDRRIRERAADYREGEAQK